MIVTGETYVLIIGIEDYVNKESFKKVRYASKDANDISDAFILSGVPKPNIRILINGEATKTIINKEIEILSKKSNGNDRLIFFYAGHGLFSSETNWIAPFDAYITDVSSTCISVKHILGQLKESDSNKSIVFLDCCHSGFEPGEKERETSSNFVIDDLLYYYKDEEYCYGFSSAKKDEISVSNDNLKNGVWTHFLVRALTGNGPKRIYEKSILFNDNLQSYLNKEVSEFVVLNTKKKTQQTPTTFGSQTDRFPIVDLSTTFSERAAAKAYSGIRFESVSMISCDVNDIKTLSGFKKGSHKIPTDVHTATQSFVSSISGAEIKEEITQITSRLKELGYKLRQVDTFVESGQGSINTPDFLYSVVVEQNEENPKEYVLTRVLEGFQNSEILQNKIFNDIFSKHFDELNFRLDKEVEIEQLIESIEELDNEGIEVDFDFTDTTWCRIKIEGLEYEVLVKENTISITYYRMTNPIGLTEAFKETYEKLLSTTDIKLLE